MVAVNYDHEIAYGYDPNGKSYPRLTVRLINPADVEQAIDLDAYLDSGAERSIFTGNLAPLIGIELMAGEEIVFEPAIGVSTAGRLHAVRVSHEALGTFDIEVAFSTGQLSRNLLGRDFFNRLQVGFRESQAVFYVTATP